MYNHCCNDNSLFFTIGRHGSKKREAKKSRSQNHFLIHADRAPSGATNGAVIIHLCFSLIVTHHSVILLAFIRSFLTKAIEFSP